MSALLELIRADLGSFVGTVFALGAMFAAAEGMRTFGVLPEVTRKFTHVFAGLWVVLTPSLFSTAPPVILLCLMFMGLMMITHATGLLPSVHGVDRKSIGPTLYPLGIIGAALLLWDHTALFRSAVLVLALGDAAADFVGRARGRHPHAVGQHHRTLEGTGVLFAIALVVTALALGGSATLNWPAALVGGLIVAATVAAAEGISPFGADNLIIPLAASLWLAELVRSPELVYQHGANALLCAVIAVVSWRRRNLTVAGALGAGLLGLAVLAGGGLPWFAALLTVFVGVNLASRIGKGRKPKQAKGSQRDHIQIFANVGVGGVLALAVAAQIVNPNPAVLGGFFGALGFAGADTLASELGAVFGRSPRSITTGRRVPAGANGGVSAAGYGAALIGGLLAPLGYALASGGVDYGTLLASAIGGMAGCTIDSILGDTVQARRRCSTCGASTEGELHCDAPTELQGGIRWIDNDVVNLAGSLFGAAIGLALGYAHWRLTDVSP